MLWRTHFMIGATTGFLLTNHLGPKISLISTAVGGVTAILADIDDHKSYIGRLIPIIPRVLNATIDHRGPTHSILGAGAMALLVASLVRGYIPVSWSFLLFVVFLSCLSHPIIDVFNSGSKGCPLLWPLPMYFRIPLFKAGGYIEKLIFFPVTVVLLYWITLPYAKSWLRGVLSIEKFF